ncbi:P-loop containing nucleoside triphosphate hydrolase protein [Mycena alexandri]|uniref:P-loop containing nucleoside triphosphate hydrolase protein n=1 Tax=Mycena alexandri TaxID=1745969 RepID=A0AAD6X3U7_9AGAR|nr:P-loop containing nucleoside triphosphate hydrolase protein [Mycena alexandri]
MLPSEPKIFHGREKELSDILKLFKEGSPRIAILGAGGMGKTSLARAIIHHQEIAARYEQHRFFVACDSAANKVELAALIGVHLGLKPGKDLTQSVVQHFTGGPPSLLILDNLETVWEPRESRGDVEEFLSLLTDIGHLGLLITMRGAERPAKVAWTRPFLSSLRPLKQDAARQTFIDIVKDCHSPEDVDKVLSLTDNLPLAIDLIAHLVDLEGCSNVLAWWETDKTCLISEGYDKRSNLDLSISLSLSSPRIKSVPHSDELLSLLSILPDGLSDVELLQSKLPIENILGCKAALIRTALAYNDEQKRLKALVPIREYMYKIQPPSDYLIRPLLKHFHALLELHREFLGTPVSSATVVQISSNLTNIKNVLRNGLRQDHLDLKDSILCTLFLNVFSRTTGRGTIALLHQLPNVLPHCCDHQLEAYFITELFGSWRHYLISDPESLVAQALKHFGKCDYPDLECRLFV